MLEDIVKLAKTTYPKLAVSIDVRNMPLSEEDLQKQLELGRKIQQKEREIALSKK